MALKFWEFNILIAVPVCVWGGGGGGLQQREQSGRKREGVMEIGQAQCSLVKGEVCYVSREIPLPPHTHLFERAPTTVNSFIWFFSGVGVLSNITTCMVNITLYFPVCGWCGEKGPFRVVVCVHGGEVTITNMGVM